MEQPDYPQEAERMLTETERDMSNSRRGAFQRLLEDLNISRETIRTARVPEWFGSDKLLEWFSDDKNLKSLFDAYEVRQGDAYEGTVNGHTVRAGRATFFKEEMSGSRADAIVTLASIDGLYVGDEEQAENLVKVLSNLHWAQRVDPEDVEELDAERQLASPDLIADVLR